jgi:hypothetical protein
MMSDGDRVAALRRKYREATGQINAEGWIDVYRTGTATLEARPVDRQDDRDEGEQIESDEWLIREPNGESYTVSEETFESEFDDAGQYHMRRFQIDLSWDAIGADDDSVPTIAGKDCYVYVDAQIHVPTDSVVAMDVVGVELGDNEQYDSLPLDALYDSDRVADVAAND